MTSQLNGLYALVAVARDGSFTRAAQRLNVSTSTLSQTVRSVESALGVRVFNRTTRQVTLTEEGRRLLAEITPALAQIDMAVEAAMQRRDLPSGTLRINASRTAIGLLLLPQLPQFLRQYPQITVDICADDSLTDLVSGGFDAGIRLGETLTPGMVATPVGTPQQLVLVASPAYLQRSGTPASLDALQQHACIGFRLPGSGRIRPWYFQQRGREKKVVAATALALNDGALILQAAIHGAGIAQVFAGAAQAAIASGALVQVLAHTASAAERFYIYHPARAQMPPKLRVWIDWLKKPQLEHA